MLGRWCCGFAADETVEFLKTALPVLIVAVGHPVDTVVRQASLKTARPGAFCGPISHRSEGGLQAASSASCKRGHVTDVKHLGRSGRSRIARSNARRKSCDLSARSKEACPP